MTAPTRRHWAARCCLSSRTSNRNACRSSVSPPPTARDAVPHTARPAADLARYGDAFRAHRRWMTHRPVCPHRLLRVLESVLRRSDGLCRRADTGVLLSAWPPDGALNVPLPSGLAVGSERQPHRSTRLSDSAPPAMSRRDSPSSRVPQHSRSPSLGHLVVPPRAHLCPRRRPRRRHGHPVRPEPLPLLGGTPTPVRPSAHSATVKLSKHLQEDAGSTWAPISSSPRDNHLRHAAGIVRTPVPSTRLGSARRHHRRQAIPHTHSRPPQHRERPGPITCWKVGWWWSKCSCLPALSFTPDSSSPAYVPAVSLGVGAQTLHTRHPDPQAPDVPQTSTHQSPSRRAPSRRPSVRTIQGRPSVRSRGGSHLNAPQACNPTPSPVLPPVSSRRPRRRIHALPRAPLARPAPTAVAHRLLPPLGACQSPRPRTGRLRNRHRPRPTSHCRGRRQQSQPKVPNLITSTGRLGERNYPHSNRNSNIERVKNYLSVWATERAREVCERVWQ